MKVLNINAVNGIKSTGRICLEIADYLNNNGHEGYIAYSNGLPYEKGYKIGTPAEIKLHGLLSRVFGMQAYSSKNGTCKLLKYIKDIKPNVVHLHNLHGNYINLKLLVSFLAENDIPTVLTLHDCWFYTGKCTHYTVDGCYKWQSGCGNCPRLKKDNPSWFFDCTKKMYIDKKEWFEKIPRLAVVGVSEWITNETRQSLLASAKIVTRIYNWIDFEVFKPIETDFLRHKLDLMNKFIILGIASGWSNAKGLDKFIELADQIPDDMSIILVGDISVNIHLPKNIIHFKETNNMNELIKYYSIANVFVNFSLEEAFGKVSVEALACGTPVITYFSTANSELVGDRCGYIVEKNDFTGIKNAIFNVNKKGKEYYKDNCISFAKANFNKEDRINEYINLYQELLK